MILWYQARQARLGYAPSHFPHLLGVTQGLVMAQLVFLMVANYLAFGRVGYSRLGHRVGWVGYLYKSGADGGDGLIQNDEYYVALDDAI